MQGGITRKLHSLSRWSDVQHPPMKVPPFMWRYCSQRHLHNCAQICAKNKKTQGRYWRFKASLSNMQIFDHFLVLDFEATCEKDNKLPIQEIIEFPCLKVNAITMNIESVFHQYVQPSINPNLTPFCTQLTGITQEMIDGQCDIQTTLQKFDLWIKEQGVCNNRSAFVTCGDWDLQSMLPKQCMNENIELPSYFTSWINLKQAFADATGHYPRGIINMMSLLGIKHSGRLHSGIDDCRNIASIMKTLASNGHIFRKTGHALPPPMKPVTSS